MVTQEQLNSWIKETDIITKPIENGIQFGGDNPWDEIENATYTGSIRLIDGTIHIDFVDGEWNGYGEEQYTNLQEFAARWTDVMENGLTG